MCVCVCVIEKSSSLVLLFWTQIEISLRVTANSICHNKRKHTNRRRAPTHMFFSVIFDPCALCIRLFHMSAVPVVYTSSYIFAPERWENTNTHTMTNKHHHSAPSDRLHILLPSPSNSSSPEFTFPPHLRTAECTHEYSSKLQPVPRGETHFGEERGLATPSTGTLLGLFKSSCGCFPLSLCLSLLMMLHY